MGWWIPDVFYYYCRTCKKTHCSGPPPLGVLQAVLERSYGSTRPARYYVREVADPVPPLRRPVYYSGPPPPAARYYATAVYESDSDSSLSEDEPGLSRSLARAADAAERCRVASRRMKKTLKKDLRHALYVR